MASIGGTKDTVVDTSEKPEDDPDSVTQYGETSEDLSSDSVLVKKGKALIISNNFYGSGDERIGNNKDKEALIGLFNRIGVQPEIIEDTRERYLRKEDVSTRLKCWSENKDGILDDADCLIVVIMSHGGVYEVTNEEYILFIGNDKLELSTIFKMFTNNRCKAMCGKPKLFFIQSCRGLKQDHGTVITRTTTSDSHQHIEIGNWADFLIGQSSFKDHISYLSKGGSWYIQSIVDVFHMRIPQNKELNEMMLEVNKRVSKNSADRVGGVQLKPGNIVKQVSSFTSSLTKSVFFQLRGN